MPHRATTVYYGRLSGIGASCAGWSRPIRPLLRDGHFTPEDITVLIAAFEDALLALHVRDRGHPTVTLVAKRVIELARQGERDPDLLRDAVLKSIRDDHGVSGL
jgi:hypothetical protein